MNHKASAMPRSSDVRFADTRGTGGITVRGFELQTGSDGCIEGPRDLAGDVESHGFFPEGSMQFAAWEKARADKAEAEKAEAARAPKANEAPAAAAPAGAAKGGKGPEKL